MCFLSTKKRNKFIGDSAYNGLKETNCNEGDDKSSNLHISSSKEL
jgi:hypothetical protein